MRKLEINAVQYTPAPVPAELPPEVRRYLDDELNRIASLLRILAAGHLDVMFAPPPKPRRGDLTYADGVDWDPGSGEGPYYHNGTIWKPLG